MNVVMINSGYDGCCYLRILLPAYHNGFMTDKASPKAGRLEVKEYQQMFDNADVVVFHRPEEPEYYHIAEMLKRDGKKIVMDNDDTFKLDDHHPLADWQPNGKFAVVLERRAKAIDDFMKLADLVTTSTEFLAKEYRKINPNVAVLPNCVDPMDWDEPLRNESEIVRIGLVGSATYDYDFKHIKPLLRKLSKRKDVQLVLFGLGDAKHRKDNPKVTEAFKDEYQFWDSINKEQIPWCPVYEYPTKLNEARLDMMLIPRKVNYFNRCKSNVKFLEAAMCEIPVIAQSYSDGPYEELEGQGMGILISDNKKWEGVVNEMIKFKKMRRDMGKNAKEYALNHYNIEDKAQMWADAYKTLF